MRQPATHPSLPSHLSTELGLLGALIKRSKDQHRLQPFFRKMKEVYRVGTRVQDIVKVVSDGGDGEVSQKHRQLVGNMIYTLIKSSASTSQIIELQHFLPLQTLVLAIYARLFTIALNLASVLQIDLQEVLARQGRIARRKAVSVSAPVPGSLASQANPTPTVAIQLDEEVGIELGERIERPVRLAMPASQLSSRDFASNAPDHNRAKRISPSPMPPSESEAAHDELRSTDKQTTVIKTSHHGQRRSSSSGSLESIALPRTIGLTAAVDKESEKAPKVKKRPAAPLASKLTAKKSKSKSKSKKRDDLDDIFGF